MTLTVLSANRSKLNTELTPVECDRRLAKNNLSDKVRYRFLHSLEISQGRKERTRNRTIVTQINMSLPSQIFIPHLVITKVTGKICILFSPASKVRIE